MGVKRGWVLGSLSRWRRLRLSSQVATSGLAAATDSLIDPFVDIVKINHTL